MLAWHLALRISLAGPADDAAILLSRYPAGTVPPTSTILSAIEEIAQDGGGEHLGVLRSLVVHESGAVRSAAQTATAEVFRNDLRRRFAATVPGNEALAAWIDAHAADLVRSDGSVLGRSEREMVAYAALVLRADRAPIEPDMSTAVGTASDLAQAAADRELRGEPEVALALYARALVAGDDLAIERIRDFGVDPERLLLGMTASPKRSLVVRVDPTAVDVLVREGSVFTVAVLSERATHAGPGDRVVAADALGRMLESDRLPPGARRAALRSLEAAARDGEPAVREAAFVALHPAGTD